MPEPVRATVKIEPAPMPLLWARVLETEPDVQVVRDPIVLESLRRLGLPWRVEDTKSGIEMLLVAPGDFLRGSPENEEGRDTKDESPQHRVRITKPLYVGRSAVTVRQWRSFAESSNHRTVAEREGNGWTLSKDGLVWGQEKRATWMTPLPHQPDFELEEDHPVVMVSWNDASKFVEAFGLRLLTEAEWEFVARAGTKTSRWWGSAVTDGQGCGNFADQSLKARFPKRKFDEFPFDDGAVFLSGVGRYRSNPWGFHDVLGNVWEWCSDWYQEDEYQRWANGVTDPSGPAKDTGFRVLRGGSWLHPPSHVRAAYRVRYAPTYSLVFVGFRVARAPR